MTSGPGTVATGGTDTATPLADCWSVVLTVQSPAPPPASESATWRTDEAPGSTKPNARLVGDAKTSGRSARTRSIVPPPSRVVSASAPPGTEDRLAGQHERGLDLLDRPAAMALAQQCRGARDVRRRHARPAEARPEALAARHRREHVLAGRGHVRLHAQRDRRRPARGEGRDERPALALGGGRDRARGAARRGRPILRRGPRSRSRPRRPARLRPQRRRRARGRRCRGSDRSPPRRARG